MAKKIHSNIIEEYQFVKTKIKKLRIKYERSQTCAKARIARKISSLMDRILEIQDICKENEYPHPDAYNEKPRMMSLDQLEQLKLKAKFLPDGTRYEHPIKVEDSE